MVTEEKKKVFIIAEAGVNHNGDIATAKRMIETAAFAGTDAIKFQTFRAEKIVIRTAKKAAYQIEHTQNNESQLAMLKRLEFDRSAHTELMSYCRKKNICFLSAPFDKESADLLEGLGMDCFKIPSGELTNKPLIQHIAAKRKDIILSTGMSTLDEVRKTIMWIRQIWDTLRCRPALTLLHCVSNYPAQPAEVNLKAMHTLNVVFGLPVGFSDHTLGTEIAIAACALGAEVIEKHFTLDREMPGPDHKISLVPVELESMIKAIRNVEQALGTGIKQPTRMEEEMKRLFRKSLVAARDLRAGEIVSAEDIEAKRPGDGMSPANVGLIANRSLRVNVLKDTPFALEHFV